MKILIVGAGFAGAVIANYLAQHSSHRIVVIDRRNHVAGNAHDPVHPSLGSRYHQYGPHIFHTNDRDIVDYLSRFTDWLPYQHRVQAVLPDNHYVPLPINRDTLARFFATDLPDEAAVRELLAEHAIPILKPRSALEHLHSVYGSELTALFFGNYTRKMWDLDLSELPASVVARLPLRYDDNPYYFNDRYQMLPKDGYTALVERMLSHDRIEVQLQRSFSRAMEADYDHVFNSMPIDEYYNEVYGPLPYRSIQFEHHFNEPWNADVPTLNFTDQGPYTRKTTWALYPGCGGEPGAHVTYERPCSYTDNNLERYYPVKTVDGWPQRRYQRYAELAKGQPRMTFIGRCGQYIYYDMHQVVANSLMIARNFSENGRVAAGS